MRAGEFLALIGENGAGKTTAMSVLFGLLRPDSGTVEINNTPLRGHKVSDAIAAGLGMVHQHFKLYPDLTVLENIIVGGENASAFLGTIPFARHRRKAQAIIAEFDFPLSLDQKVSSLPVDARQQLEIVKLLYRGASIIILDEPTAVLTPQESLALYRMLARLREKGTSVLLITHKLDEVMENAQRVVVMRRGEVVAERLCAHTSQTELAELMVGRRIEPVEKRSPLPSPAAVPQCALTLRALTVGGTGTKPALDRLDLDLHGGEILGIAGISGSGQKELANAVIGLERVRGGRIAFGEEDITALTVARRRALGIGYMAEDRMGMGLAGRGTVAENLISGREASAQFARAGFLRKRAVASYARALIERFDIRTPSPRAAVGTLSGGNQQKAIVARELSMKPRLLVVENPCWGVDVGAISFIHRQILDLAAQGCAILLVSTDLEELITLSDRIGVLFDGRLVRWFERAEMDSFEIGAAMSGHVDTAQ